MSSSAPAAGQSRRFWITVAIFVVANVAAWLGYHYWHQRALTGLLEVVSVSPGGEQIPADRPVIAWQFNMDMAGAAAGAGDERAPGAIAPAVPGRWEWTDARTLAFSAEGDLPKGTEFTFSLWPQRLRSVQGCVLGKPYVTTVHTPGLGLASVRQASVEGDRYIIELEFSDSILPADLKSKLTLTLRGHAVGYRMLGQAAAQTIRVETHALPDGPVTLQVAGAPSGAMTLHVAVAPGLVGASGPLAMTRPFEQDLTLEKPLSVTEVTASSPANGQCSIYLQLNGEADLKLLKTALSVEPAVPFVLTSEWRGVRLHGDFVPGLRYAVKITRPEGLAETVKLPRATTTSVMVPDRDKRVWFDYPDGYLGSAGNRTVMAHAVNVPEMRVLVWRVYDSNLVQWRNFGQRHYWQDPTTYSRPLAQKVIATGADRNQVRDVPIALDSLLPGEAMRDGVYRVMVQSGLPPAGKEEEDGEEYSTSSDATVATLSDIGLTAKRTKNAVTLWAVSLRTAKPLGDVRVRLYSNKNQLLGEAVTSSDGLATIGDVHPAEGEQAAVVLADQADGKGLTWLDLNAGAWKLSDADTKGREYLHKGAEAFIYTERGVYRPGETVHLRAILRNAEMRAPQSFPVKWQIRRPDLHDWRGKAAVLDQDGAAEWTVQLPADVPTGQWSADLCVPGTKSQSLGTISFYVEEFVPNRLKASLVLKQPAPDDGAEKSGGERRFALAEDRPIVAEMQADYLFGRPGAGLSADFSARLDPIAFAPEKWAGWAFGDQADAGTVGTGKVAIADDEDGDEEIHLPAPDGPVRQGRGKIDGKTMVLDEEGHATWKLPLKELKVGGDGGAAAYQGPWRLSAAASVEEPGGRAVTVGDSVSVDVQKWYVGVRAPEAAIKPGIASEFSVALVKPDGGIAAEDKELDCQLFHENYSSVMVRREGRYQYESQRKLDPVQGVSGKVRIHEGRGEVSLTAPFSGPFILKVSGGAGESIATLAFYAADGSGWNDNISRQNPERLQLSLIRLDSEGAGATTLPATRPATMPTTLATTMPTTLPSETMRGGAKLSVGQMVGVLVRSPFPGRLLLSIETDEVITSQVVEMSQTAKIVPITVSAACRPNAYITATVVRNVEPDVKWRVHRACGVMRLSVDPAAHRLDVGLDTVAEMRPAGPLTVNVLVRSADGQPARDAAVTVAAVDEGVLQLTAFRTPNPLGFFYSARALGVMSGDIYTMLMPEVPRPGKVSQVGGDGESAERHLTAVHSSRVKPVALVSEVLHTDAAGHATVQLAVPQFSGQLRVMAVASSADAVGSADKAVLVRSPLLVQTSFPRFVAPGDRFDATVTLFNNAKEDGQVRLSADVGKDLLSFTPGAIPAETIALKAGAQRTIRLPVQVGQTAGVVTISVKAVMGEESTQESVELPIRPAAPMISKGGYVAVEPGKPVDLALTEPLLAGTRRVDVNITPWPTLSLPDGLDYLERYPYGCAEQTISTCFPLVYLSDLGQQIAPGMFEKQRVADKLQVGIYRMMAMQTGDGGLAMWPGSSESWPWASVYGAHLLVEAERSGFAVPADFRDRLLGHVRRMLEQMPEGDMLETQAYACYVLALADKPDRAAMSRLDELSRSAAGPADSIRSQARLHLAMAWMLAGRRDLAAAMIPDTLPTPRAARQLGGNIGSPVRDQAILVSTLLAVNPEHPALPDLVQKLADGGRKGGWRSTQDCAFAVMAIGRYLRQAKTHEPCDTVELLDVVQRLASAAKGQSIAWTGSDAKAPLPGHLRVVATGAPAARAHLSWLQTGVPLALPADADHGIQIRRRYLDEDGKPVPLDKIHSGDLVHVELTVDTPAAQENLVIEDLLPAGLEIENARLATSARDDQDTDVQNGAPWLIAARVDIRDDRLIVIGDLSGAGVFRCSYLTRAVTPGTYVVPPVRGECMYDISINSLSGGGGSLQILPAEK